MGSVSQTRHGHLLETRGLAVGYGHVRVLRDVSLDVSEGEVVAILGPNGAGKTTLLLTVAGELPPMAGGLLWRGQPSGLPLHRRARQGLALVTEGRSLCASLTVRQNLRIGRDCDTDRAIAMFPELLPLMPRRAGLLSGGEQQMLTLARALARPVELLLADELSLGLAPQTAGRLLTEVRLAADRGMGALIVEQHVSRALEIADRVHVLSGGQVVFSGSSTAARNQLDAIQAHYLSRDGSEHDHDQLQSPSQPMAPGEQESMRSTTPSRGARP